MKLTFPFKNIVVNHLLEFYDKDRVKDYSEIKAGKSFLDKDHFSFQIEDWKSELPSFENEILQIISTTDQQTIDAYFAELAGNIEYVKSCNTHEYFEQKIFQWNIDILAEYEANIEKETEIYFKEENRKRKHLEEYEDWDNSSFFSLNAKPRKITRTNYNFFCVSKEPELIDDNFIDEYVSLVSNISGDLASLSLKYGIPWKEGQIKSSVEKRLMPKPALFVEGDLDIQYLKAAAKYLKKEEVLSSIELRQRGGCSNLDKLWNILKEESWETTPQIKIFLYDCDTNKSNEDFGVHFRRVIPTISEGLIRKGIENLIPNHFIEEVVKSNPKFIDVRTVEGTLRGEKYKETFYEINKDEKRNFCDWVCESAPESTFNNFMTVFEIIERLVPNNNR